jgi:hypothetical protein
MHILLSYHRRDYHKAIFKKIRMDAFASSTQYNISNASNMHINNPQQGQNIQALERPKRMNTKLKHIKNMKITTNSSGGKQISKRDYNTKRVLI